jgi:hypothetical protein
MSYAFKSQLKLGNLGETIFYEVNCDHLMKTDGREGDFVCKETGEKTELKTDMWSMFSTPNFFFERYSDKDKMSPGGPWQALTHGCKYFIYFYVTNMTYFRFDAKDLVQVLDDIITQMKPTEIKNATYTTVGYRVPRELVTHLAEVVKLKVTK